MWYCRTPESVGVSCPNPSGLETKPPTMDAKCLDLFFPGSFAPLR